MMKVILADDERKITMLMERLVDWEDLGYEIIGIASDGRRALELIEKYHPHLLITDIRMPGYDGIELLRLARDLDKDLHFVVVSGYPQFEYVQSALKFGAEDYLLKPLKKVELEGILQKIRHKFFQKREVELLLEKEKEGREEKFLDYIRRCQIGNHKLLSRELVNEIYGFHFLEGIFFMAAIRITIADMALEKDHYKLLLHHGLRIARREVNTVFKESGVAIFPEGIVLIGNVTSFRKLEIVQCFTRIRKEIEKEGDAFQGIKVSVFLSYRTSQIEEVPQCYGQVLWLAKDSICHVSKWRDGEEMAWPMSQPPYKLGFLQKKKLQQFLEIGKKDEVIREIKSCFVDLISSPELHGDQVEAWCQEMISLIKKGIAVWSGQEYAEDEKSAVNFWDCSSDSQILEGLIDMTRREIERLEEERQRAEAKPVAEAKKFIRQHYQEDIRLEDVSSFVGFNPTYFSTLFKKETGQNFSNYLAEIRIEAAKELLREENISTADVAEMVGYKDMKYFSRLFKKITGVNPTVYKKMYH